MRLSRSNVSKAGLNLLLYFDTNYFMLLSFLSFKKSNKYFSPNFWSNAFCPPARLTRSNFLKIYFLVKGIINFSGINKVQASGVMVKRIGAIRIIENNYAHHSKNMGI